MVSVRVGVAERAAQTGEVVRQPRLFHQHISGKSWFCTGTRRHMADAFPRDVELVNEIRPGQPVQLGARAQQGRSTRRFAAADDTKKGSTPFSATRNLGSTPTVYLNVTGQHVW